MSSPDAIQSLQRGESEPYPLQEPVDSLEFLQYAHGKGALFFSSGFLPLQKPDFISLISKCLHRSQAIAVGRLQGLMMLNGRHSTQTEQLFGLAEGSRRELVVVAGTEKFVVTW